VRPTALSPELDWGRWSHGQDAGSLHSWEEGVMVIAAVPGRAPPWGGLYSCYSFIAFVCIDLRRSQNTEVVGRTGPWGEQQSKLCQWPSHPGPSDLMSLQLSVLTGGLLGGPLHCVCTCARACVCTCANVRVCLCLCVLSLCVGVHARVSTCACVCSDGGGHGGTRYRMTPLHASAWSSVRAQARTAMDVIWSLT
jgi:hypothetical protein